MDDAHEVTRLLEAWGSGDPEALDRLILAVYDELRALARYHLRGERRDLTLQPTALLNEVYIRLIDAAGTDWQSRRQFFAFAGLLMRRILVDNARRRVTVKRGGRAPQLAVRDDLFIPAEGELQVEEILSLHAALQRLEQLNPRQARIVELRFFLGLTLDETVDALGLSRATVSRDWEAARHWLARELGAGGGRPS